ncbi:MAG: TolC family protein, partial [Thermoanaerobaculia bacterium]
MWIMVVGRHSLRHSRHAAGMVSFGLLTWVLAFSRAEGQEVVPDLRPVDFDQRPQAASATGERRLTLAEARALALASNPDLRAVRLEVKIAEGELRQGSLLVRSNPSVEVLGGGPGTEVDVSQELEIAGQRGARREAGLAGIDRATASVLDAARATIAEVDRAFYRLVADLQREQLSDEVLSLNRRLADVASRQVAAGGISQLEQNLATVELGRSRSRALAARRERETTQSELGRFLGLEPGAAIVPSLEVDPART